MILWQHFRKWTMLLRIFDTGYTLQLQGYRNNTCLGGLPYTNGTYFGLFGGLEPLYNSDFLQPLTHATNQNHTFCQERFGNQECRICSIQPPPSMSTARNFNQIPRFTCSSSLVAVMERRLSYHTRIFCNSSYTYIHMIWQLIYQAKIIQIPCY